MSDKKYTGYGYHGGGRPRKSEADKAKYVTTTICGSPENVERLKQHARREGLTVSRFVLLLDEQYENTL